MLKSNYETGTIQMYGEIGSYIEEGISDRDLIDILGQMDGQDITISLKSDGGDVFEGLSIYNQLAHYDGKVTIVVDALAASIASVIAMAADDIAIHENSMMMIHNPWTVALGDAKEFRGVADLLDRVAADIAGIYSRRSGRDDKHYLEVMETDTYYSAQEALESGLVDRIIEVGSSKSTQNIAAATQKPVVSAAAFPRRNHCERRIRLTSKR
jgi:ATP-dependent Clp protease protease subunit